MTLADSYLAEFDREMANTRKTLERIPDDKLDYTPHPKSWALGKLATHIATLLQWVGKTMEADSLNMSPDDPPPTPAPFQSQKEAVETFDTNVAAAREAIVGASDEDLLAPWSLLADGKTMFTMPRIGVLKSFILSHSIHHRAQLGLYLRLNDIPMPAIYGPSADEGGM